MTAPELASYALTLTFLWAASAKVFGFGRWTQTVRGYGFGGDAAEAISLSVPIAEATVAALLLAGFRSVGAALALALLAAFSYAIVRATKTQGSRLPCGCFGGSKERDFRAMLLRNALLAVLAAVILVGRRFGPSLLQEPVDGVPFILTVLGAVVICWTLWQVFSSLRGRRHS